MSEKCSFVVKNSYSSWKYIYFLALTCFEGLRWCTKFTDPKLNNNKERPIIDRQKQKDALATGAFIFYPRGKESWQFKLGGKIQTRVLLLLLCFALEDSS